MYRMRVVATAGITGAAIAVAGAAAAWATPAPAYSTWPSAQRAAGFPLHRPTKTFGLKRAGGILVTPCAVTGHLRWRDVGANYEGTRHRVLAIEQNNSGAPCSNFGEARLLGHYAVDGTTADLFGVCGMHGLPPCSSVNKYLFLTWVRHGISFQGTSHNEPRTSLVAFARALVLVH
jgi:hypothetical protein